MKRFDDFLKLLLSVLVGQVVKESDEISQHLETYFASAPGPVVGASASLRTFVAQYLPFLLVALYLKNIHASLQYDRCAHEAKYAPKLEKSTFGRSLTFAFSILALFVFPFWAEHELAKHLNVSFSIYSLATFLFGPFVIYLVWDGILFLERPDPTSTQHDALANVVHRWFKLDLAGLAAAGIAVLVGVVQVHNGFVVRPEYVALGFMILTLINVTVDYVVNARFYFSDPAVALRAPARARRRGGTEDRLLPPAFPPSAAPTVTPDSASSSQ